MADLTVHSATLSDIVRRTKSGELTAVQVAEAMLARIDRLDAELGAYAWRDGEAVRRRAEQLDAAQAGGDPLGPLHGAPVALKDLLCTQDAPTTCGTSVLADWRPDYDATVVRRLEAAGALVLGKVKLTEGAYGEHHPSVSPPRNPWHHGRWSGASSSGSAAAVAAGLAHGAIGTDTGGSIRFPSASCGLVGIKPTYGLVSRHGAFPLADSLDHVGPMTRSVADAARMLEVMAGHDAADPSSLAAPPPSFAGSFRETLDGVRIGVDWHYVGDGVDDSQLATVRDALALLGTLGAETQAVQLPDPNELVDGWQITCGAECARAHADTYPSRKDEYGPALAALIETGRGASAMQYAHLERLRVAFRSGLNRLFDGGGGSDAVDALIAPCLPVPIPAAERTAAAGRSERFIRFTAPFDYSGHPSITLPLDVDAEGLPRAFQLIGPHLGEGQLIGIGSAFEKAAGFRYRTLD